MNSEKYPLQKIEEILNDEYILSWLPTIEGAYFKQYLVFEDYVAERLERLISPLLRETYSKLHEDIMNSYWDRERNQNRARFYGHRMLLILETINLSYLLFPYFQLICEFFKNFERRLKHDLDCDMGFSDRLENNQTFKLLESQKAVRWDTHPIADLAPILPPEVPKKSATSGRKLIQIAPNYKELIDKHLDFLHPSRSPLSQHQFLSLKLILIRTVEDQRETQATERFYQVVTKEVSKKIIRLHFKELTKELCPGNRPAWFTNTIAILFGYKDKKSLYNNWTS